MSQVKKAKICMLSPAEHEVNARCDLPHGWRLSGRTTNKTIQQPFKDSGTAGPVGIDVPEHKRVRTSLAAVRVFGEGREEHAALIVKAVNDVIANATI